MSLTKKDIVKSISKQTSNNEIISAKILEFFIDAIKKHSNNKYVKISGFGSFYYKKTKKRVGRNPKTMESYIIAPRNKLHLSTSNEVKKLLN